MDTSESSLLTIPEVASALRMSRATVYVLIGKEEISAVHIGRSTRITRAELDRYIATLVAAASKP